MLNKDGTPRVFYHGTNTVNGNFEIFDSSKAVKRGGLGLKALGKGNYFTTVKLTGNERYYVGVMLQRDSNTQRLYIHDVLQEKETADISHASSSIFKDAKNEDHLFLASIIHNALNVKGISSYWKQVAELYNRVIMDTQPMYDVLHRTELMKKNNKFISGLLMFKTVPFQQFGIVADSYGEFFAARSRYLADKSEENKRKNKRTLIFQGSFVGARNGT